MTFEASCYPDPLALVGLVPPHAARHGRESAHAEAGQVRGIKHVYPKDMMVGLRGWFEEAIAERLPACRVLYWT